MDIGGPAVQALLFLARDSPWGKSANPTDLVITGTLVRAKLIQKQLAFQKLPGKSDLQLYIQNNQTHLRVSNSSQLQKNISTANPASKEHILNELGTQREERLENIRHDQNVDKLFLSLETLDFDLLDDARGTTPLFQWRISRTSCPIKKQAAAQITRGSTLQPQRDL